MSSPEPEITALLKQMGDGSSEAKDQLWQAVYRQLRQMAHFKLLGEGHPDLMTTTSLVHEAYIKINLSDPDAIENRAHFFSIVSNAMRQVLVENARKRLAKKRAYETAPQPFQDTQILQVHELLDHLAQNHKRLTQVVAWRFFGGFENQTIAEVLKVSTKTVERDWKRAKAYLRMASELDETVQTKD